MSIIWVYISVPETRKVALEDMVSLFVVLIQDRVFGDAEGEREILHRRRLLERLSSAEHE
jgi:hypothetical protein